MRPVQYSAWKQRFEGQDQLRQRVADALLQIYVVSMYLNKTPHPGPLRGWPSYLDVLNRNAFGNFRDLLRDVTLSPGDGRVPQHEAAARKSDPVLQTQPDENYAREVMQLFTVGLVMLNEDGSVQARRRRQAAADVQRGHGQGLRQGALRLALGGRRPSSRSRGVGSTITYLDNAGSATAQLQYACDAMEPADAAVAARRTRSRRPTRGRSRGPAHDQGAKQLMVYPGAPYSTLPAGQTPQADLENVLDNLFHHPNVGPFIGKQLIQRLVTSNPSPAYVARVARKFNDNGSGVRGDMKAVVRAILLDDEARSLAVGEPADVRQADRAGDSLRPVFPRVQRACAAGYDLPCRARSRRTDSTSTR